MIKYKYNISIEQPMCKTWEIEAESAEQAEEIAKEKYNSGEFVIGPEDTGTDAQIMTEREDGNDSPDWHDL
jgi:hypothetical protein